jgi:hypothetical protein
MHIPQSVCGCQKSGIFLLLEKIKILQKLKSGIIATHLLMKNHLQL